MKCVQLRKRRCEVRLRLMPAQAAGPGTQMVEVPLTGARLPIPCSCFYDGAPGGGAVGLRCTGEVYEAQAACTIAIASQQPVGCSGSMIWPTVRFRSHACSLSELLASVHQPACSWSAQRALQQSRQAAGTSCFFRALLLLQSRHALPAISPTSLSSVAD